MVAPRLCLIVVAALLAGCDAHLPEQEPLTGGNARNGKDLVRQTGCGSCHTIKGIPGASATVGPSLEDVKKRTYLAGRLENKPANLIKWIRNPREIDPKTAMPQLDLSEAQARDIAAYLYSR